jgi:hypothetical protein
MKLTNKQIKEVEDYLNKKSLDYIDIHLEVLDHISTDVENLMEKNQLHFNQAFEEVKQKWQKSFVMKSSFWLGIGNSGPKIFIDNCVKIYSYLWYKFLISTLLFGVIFYNVNELLNYSLVNNEKNILMLISIGLGVYASLILYWYIKMKIIKVKSTYSFLYYKTIIPNLFSVLILNPYLYPSYITKDNKMSSIMIVMLFVFFLTTLGGRFFYKQHLKSVSNYKKYQLQ